MTPKPHYQRSKELTVFQVNCDRLDINSSANIEYQLKRVLSANREEDFLVLDFSQIKYLCSLGLSCLLGVYKFAKRKKTTIYIINATAIPEYIIRIAAFDQLLNLDSSISELLQLSACNNVVYLPLSKF